MPLHFYLLIKKPKDQITSSCLSKFLLTIFFSLFFFLIIKICHQAAVKIYEMVHQEANERNRYRSLEE